MTFGCKYIWIYISWEPKQGNQQQMEVQMQQKLKETISGITDKMKSPNLRAVIKEPSSLLNSISSVL